jgi:transglutaminase-like putative cysteine protease
MKRLATSARTWACAVLMIVLGAPAPTSAANAPAWLTEAAASALPEYDRKVPAAALLRERTVVVRKDGRRITTERGAVRVLLAEGRDEAQCAAVYLTDGGKVRDMRGWLLAPGAAPRAYGKKDLADSRLSPNDVYNEGRIRSLSASEAAVPGAVFGYEWTTDEREVFTQIDWAFQDRLPTLVSRLSLEVPEGWRASGLAINHDPIEPQTDGLTTRWELRDLPYVPREPAAPPLSALVPRLAVDFTPGPGEHPLAATSFETWDQVSGWLGSLCEPQAALTPALRERALSLTSGKSGEMERIRAIGSYVQGLNYVSIQTGIGRGGGYTPHAASLVMEKGYGDCKDKANLMHTLLAAVDITSWLVSVYYGDPGYVREAWPSPQQFNHCIIAVRAPESDASTTRIDHETLGRLLVFDPTDPLTRVGELPESEQGSLDSGLCLVLMPSLRKSLQISYTFS